MTTKTFRTWDVDQIWLLPPSVHELVPEGHLAHFVRDTVRESLDLSAILECYSEERGYPPYHPAMMTALLLYAYAQGVYSSRKIARGCEERVDFMAVTALQKPDFRTVSDFRKRHLKELGRLFVQVLRLCRQAGLAKLGHVSLDGSKVRANASKHKAMSYARMQKAERELAAEVARWFREAEAVDSRETRRFGAERRGDELPAWVRHKQQRLAKIREAKAALEAEAAAQKPKDPPPTEPGKPRRGRPPKPPSGEPKAEAQRNFTDPDSRIMKGPDGFQQCYNVQTAVDADSQVIVACGLTQSATDRHQLKPLVARIKAHTRRVPEEVSADSDYCTEENLAELQRRHIRGYVATGKQLHGQPVPAAGRKTKGPLRQKMRRRLQTGGYRSRYRLRKQTSEPVFGQIKAARGFRQFLLRGVDKVSEEWNLVCTAHNLLKLAQAVSP
jgi:transposase